MDKSLSRYLKIKKFLFVTFWSEKLSHYFWCVSNPECGTFNTWIIYVKLAYRDQRSVVVNCICCCFSKECHTQCINCNYHPILSLHVVVATGEHPTLFNGSWPAPTRKKLCMNLVSYCKVATCSLSVLPDKWRRRKETWLRINNIYTERIHVFVILTLHSEEPKGEVDESFFTLESMQFHFHNSQTNSCLFRS